MDDLAREYLLLALAADLLQHGIVDAYYGPAELRQEAKRAAVTASAVVDRTGQLRERVAAEWTGQRARWLTAQLVALETIARRLAGEEMDYLDEVERCFDARAEATPPQQYATIHADLDALLPPGPDLRARLAVRNERLAIPREYLQPAIDFALDEIAGRCKRYFRLPAGESLTVSLVNDQPWAAYNWYDGSLRSRIEVNTDLPVRATSLVGLLAHEAYPGHHLEHAWKEQRLVREQDRAESAVKLINTPESYISEGLAELGWHYVLGADEWHELLLAICARSGLDMTPERADQEWRIDRALHGLGGGSGDAALLLHVERRPVDEVRRWLEDEALRTPEQSAKDIEFIEHPLWRAYVFCYAGGESLLRRWCAAAGGPKAQRERFFRLLTEQLTPSDFRAEMAAQA
jgi:hypothetical protein